MGILANVSAPNDASDSDIISLIDAEDILADGVSRGYVVGAVAAAITGVKAPKTYVDAQDALKAPVGYYSTRDALLVPNSAKATPGGVASLVSGVVPSAQVPIFGAGILKGPWGPASSFGATTSTTPVKIAQWNIGASGVIGQPLVWLSTSAISTGRPVIEIRIGTTAQTTYASQTLIGQGFGRTQYNDYQVINVIPATPLDGDGQDGVQDTYPPSTNLLINAWIYDASGTVTTTATSIITAPLYFARTAL